MNPKNPASELREAITALNPYFRQAVFFSLCTGLLVLAPAGYMLEVYDRVVSSRSHMTLAMLTLLVLGAYVLMEVLGWVRAVIMLEASQSFDQSLSGRVVSTIFEANLRRLPGGTVQPVNDLRSIREFLYSPALLALMEAPVSLVFLVLIFAISPVLGWTAVVAAMLQTLVGWVNEQRTQPPLMAANRCAVAAQQYADVSLRNAQVIESMGMLSDIHGRWMDKHRAYLVLQAQASTLAGFYQVLSRFLQTTVSSMLLGLGAWLLLRDELRGGAGHMIVGSILGGRVLAPIVQIVTQWQVVVNVRGAYGRLESLIASMPLLPPGMALPVPKGRLQVENLVAGAPGAQVPILKGVSFALKAGEVLAVIGPSASGKTTLARLLVGVWPATQGRVRLDGVDVHTWSKVELGPHIGYLPQDVELFDGSVAENIARFGSATQGDVEQAARAVGLHEFILSLPRGYDTQVGQDGAMLSGGQRQRVALARALFCNPTFVVLDEPNSSLDAAGDEALASAIAHFKSRGTTFVVMTHRTSVLRVADKMLVLLEGQTHLFGPRDEVLNVMKEAAAKERQPTAPIRSGA